jgi:hypothetical protein
MVVDFLGIIIATLIVIIQEFLKDKIRNKWIKVVLFLLIIGSLIFSGIQIYNTNKAQDLSIKENIKLANKIDSLNNTNRLIKDQNDSLLTKVDVINNRLFPFILIAKNRYPNVTDKDALNLLASEIREVKKSIEDAKIIKIDKNIVKQGNGIQIQLRFVLTNKNIRDKIAFEIYLPKNSQADIIDLQFLGTVGLTNFSKGIEDDKKSAFMSFNVSGSEIPSFGVNLSAYSQFLLRSNYLNNDMEIK